MSILKRNEHQGQKLAYFAVVEFGHNFEKYWNPHLHIQIYYEDISVIEEAFAYVIDHTFLSEDKCDLRIAENNNASFDYVIKSFLPKNFDIALEGTKERLHKGKKMYWCSHRITPSYVIKRLYQILRELPIWKQYKNKFKLVFDLINKGVIKLEKTKSEIKKGFEKIGEWIYLIIESPETSPHINRQKTIKIKNRETEDDINKDQETTVNDDVLVDTECTDKSRDKSCEANVGTWYYFVNLLVYFIFVLAWFVKSALAFIRFTILILSGRLKVKVERSPSSIRLSWRRK